MTRYFNEVGWPETVSSDSEKDALVKDLHKLKTEKFQIAVESGLCPIRPGGSFKNIMLHSYIHTYNKFFNPYCYDALLYHRQCYG